MLELGRALAVTAAVAVVAAAAPARAQELEQFELRFVVFDQNGHGFQSPDGPAAGPGSEHALILEPLIGARIRPSPNVRHDIMLGVDVVSAASVDAIDTVSTASAINESATLDFTTTWLRGPDSEVSLRWELHIEEPLRSGSLGGGWLRRLADDNATVSASALVTVDVFDHLDRMGDDQGLSDRESVNLNLAASQVLSPTTVVDASYGLTYQHGTLETTYNQVPVEDGRRRDEVFPETRIRQAVALRIAQHVPATRSTLKLAYRYYRDDFDLQAHTAEAMLYQYLADWMYARASWRIHDQTGVSFYLDRMTSDAADAPAEPRTADSDLSPFTSNELGLKLTILSDRAPFDWLHGAAVDAAYYYYERTNGLRAHTVSLGFGRTF